jgi:hypothetical protein
MWRCRKELESAYNSELLFTLCTVFETADRWSRRLVRVLDKRGISIVVVVVVVVIIFRLLCLRFGLRFQLCLSSFGELPLLWFRNFLRVVQLLRVVPAGGLL